MCDILYRMDEVLQSALRSSGWSHGLRRGSLRTFRAGIEFEVGPLAGDEDRLELRYSYKTERTFAEGEVPLPDKTDKSAIEDTMTGVYQRVHEKPDPSRVFGSGKRSTAAPVANAAPYVPPPPDPTQGALDF
jgi:hypothetical protein